MIEKLTAKLEIRSSRAGAPAGSRGARGLRPRRRERASSRGEGTPRRRPGRRESAPASPGAGLGSARGRRRRRRADGDRAPAGRAGRLAAARAGSARRARGRRRRGRRPRARRLHGARGHRRRVDAPPDLPRPRAVDRRPGAARRPPLRRVGGGVGSIHRRGVARARVARRRIARSTPAHRRGRPPAEQGHRARPLPRGREPDLPRAGRPRPADAGTAARAATEARREGSSVRRSSCCSSIRARARLPSARATPRRARVSEAPEGDARTGASSTAAAPGPPRTRRPRAPGSCASGRRRGARRRSAAAAARGRRRGAVLVIGRPARRVRRGRRGRRRRLCRDGRPRDGRAPGARASIVHVLAEAPTARRSPSRRAGRWRSSRAQDVPPRRRARARRPGPRSSGSLTRAPP